MGNKWQTQQAFWGSFGMPAYDEQTRFTEGQEPSFPHITYQGMDGVLDETMSINASLWYKSESWEEISNKSSDIMRAISDGVMLAVDNGFFWIKLPDATPFAQRADSGSNNNQIKRILLTVEAESLTSY